MYLDPVLRTVGLAAVIGILATWLAQRLRVPAIVIYCLAGLVFGASGLGWIDLAAGADGGSVGGYLAKILPLLVAIIVFEGALMLEPEEYRRAPGAVGGLLRSGMLLTFLLTALAARFCLDFSWAPAAVLGAVFVVTGPTVIQPILRRVRLRPAIDATLRWESILIDPIGAVLAVTVIELVSNALNSREVAEAAARGIGSLVVGGAVGLGATLLSQLLLRDPRTHASREEDLNAVVLLATVLLGFLVSEAILHESGLVAVVVCGIASARSRFFGLHDVRQFKSLVATMVVSTIFVLLGSATATGWANLIDPRVVGFCAALILVVRPLAVLVGTLGSVLEPRERAYLALLAPKGIVAAALASFAGASLGGAAFTLEHPTLPQLSMGDASLAVITVCVLFYGLTAGPLASLLGVREPARRRLLLVGAGPFARALASAAYEAGLDVSLVDTNRNHVRQAASEGLDARELNALDTERLEALGLNRARAVIAMTPNDGVNALICRSLSEQIGPAGTWQVITSRSAEGGQNVEQHGGRPAFLTGLRLVGVHFALEAGTLRVVTRANPPDAPEPLPIAGPGLNLLSVRDEANWEVLGEGVAVDTLEPGEALVRLEPREGVENPLVLGLLASAEEEAGEAG